jgi:hypothetical protein
VVCPVAANRRAAQRSQDLAVQFAFAANQMTGAQDFLSALLNPDLLCGAAIFAHQNGCCAAGTDHKNRLSTYS